MAQRRPYRRRLRMESLELRQLMAGIEEGMDPSHDAAVDDSSASSTSEIAETGSGSGEGWVGTSDSGEVLADAEIPTQPAIDATEPEADSTTSTSEPVSSGASGSSESSGVSGTSSTPESSGSSGSSDSTGSSGGSGTGGTSGTSGSSGSGDSYGSGGTSGTSGSSGSSGGTGSSSAPTAGSEAPHITTFDCYIENNWLMFVGEVTDDQPPGGLVVHFGGALSGQSTTVETDGVFMLQLDPNSGVSGSIWAQVTDVNGNQSNVAFVYV